MFLLVENYNFRPNPPGSFGGQVVIFETPITCFSALSLRESRFAVMLAADGWWWALAEC